MKRFCITMDLEPDFGGRYKSFESLENNDFLFRYIKEKKVKLTTFAAGRFLDNKHKVVKELLDIGSEFESHSYSHDLNGKNYSNEIIRSRKAHIKYFGKKPMGYRAPKGILPRKELKLLKKLDFRYDASIYPTYMPGRYNNLKYPNNPFYFKEVNLIEIPFSTTRIIKIPLSMLYIRLFGLSSYKALVELFGLNDIVIFDFHLWDLKKNPNVSKLPLKWRTMFSANQDKGFYYLKWFCEKLIREGYKSVYMSDVLKHCESLKNKGKLKGFT